MMPPRGAVLGLEVLPPLHSTKQQRLCCAESCTTDLVRSASADFERLRALRFTGQRSQRNALEASTFASVET